MVTPYPTISEIQLAAERIRTYIHSTPVLTCASLDQQTGSTVYLKCENFQKCGSFKFRGACNTVFSLSDEQAQLGVATHSSGNHAQALALAAKLRGIEAFLVMPDNAPAVKKSAVIGYGGKITLCEASLQDREATLSQIVRETGAFVIHPYNDVRVITGQATAALELINQIPNLDIIMAPLGGGGLLSGTALAVAALSPACRVIGVEPEGADDAYRSIRAGRIIPSINPITIADGLLTSLGDVTFPIIQEHVADIVTVSEKEIIAAMRLVWERVKIVIEPSSAVPVGALLEKKINLTGLRIGIILSGGNVDIGLMSKYF